MKYIANPVEVEAFRIAEIVGDQDGGPGMELELEDGRHVIATHAMTARMVPQPGDYWVVQTDGYVYLNPKQVFERKYSPAVADTAA